MTSAQQLSSAADLEALWRGLFTNHPSPGMTQFLAWAEMGTDANTAHALNRAARKARKEVEAGTPMSSGRIGRYITGVLVNEREGRRSF